jgi:hypothetical protein
VHPVDKSVPGASAVAESDDDADRTHEGCNRVGNDQREIRRTNSVREPENESHQEYFLVRDGDASRAPASPDLVDLQQGGGAIATLHDAAAAANTLSTMTSCDDGTGTSAQVWVIAASRVFAVQGKDLEERPRHHAKRVLGWSPGEESADPVSSPAT